LAAAGYALRFKILGAHSIGAPGIRQRLFWVADTEGTAPRPSDNICERKSHSRNGSTSCRLVQPDSPGPHAGSGTSETARHGDSTESTGGGMGDPRDGKSPQPQEQPTREERQAVAGAGWAGRVGYTNGSGGGQADYSIARWDSFTVISTRDGKLRRISAQSGDEPLAHGIPRKLGPPLTGMGQVGIRAARANRVGRLKGYGNAIVPQVAAEFVRAYMDKKT
jgi:DNA (cytosine-5)-methyltransferase 1